MLVGYTQAQEVVNCIWLKPDSLQGKDAPIAAHADYSNSDQSNAENLIAMGWTRNGLPHVKRALLQFDLTQIPAHANIVFANMALYASEAGDPDPQHSQLSHDNAGYLDLIATDWSESVTWNTMPDINLDYRMDIEGTDDPNKDYLNIVVSDQIRYTYENPDKAFGFMLRLQNENQYAALSFASSDHHDPDKWPQLQVCYELNPISCVTLKPDSSEGKDATIVSHEDFENIGFPNVENLIAMGWTRNGDPHVKRALLEFDLNTLPYGVEVVSANMSLFASEASDPGPQHNQLTHDNSAFLDLISTSWNEDVTWNTMPSTNPLFRSVITGTENPEQDYLNIDVSGQIKYSQENPSQAFGFMLSLVDESQYAALSFASSDHHNAAKHPELEVCYKEIPVKCIVLKPDSANGKDAPIGAHPDFANKNQSNEENMLALGWTRSGQPHIKRALLQFDLSAVPNGSIVTSANMSLFASEAGGSDPQHSQLTHDNAAYLDVISSPWNESVTWNTMPNINSAYRVEMEGTANPNEDYLDVDVSEQIKYSFENPTQAYGFMIRLKNESPYAALSFATSDHPNAAKHPELEVCFVENPISCVTLKPGPIDGKDAPIGSHADFVNRDQSSEKVLMALGWTRNGQSHVKRSLLAFDMSLIPSNVHITSANLSLFSASEYWNSDPQHSQLSHDNGAYLDLISSPWEEDVTWNTKPTIDTQFRIELEGTDNPYQDYLGIDVTNQVQHGGYGFMIQLKDESKYAALAFASSDDLNPEKWPELNVCYRNPSLKDPIEEIDIHNIKGLKQLAVSNQVVLNLYPNPVVGNRNVYVHANESLIKSIEVVGMKGELIQTFDVNNYDFSLETKGMAAGLYVIKIYAGDQVVTEKLIIE